MRRAFALTLAAAVAVLPAAAAPARAEEVTAAELRELAERTRVDPDAVERLRRVDRVDGRPVDVEAALRGADDAEVAERLAHFDPAPPAGGGDPRARARELLQSRRYRGTEVPRPFSGVGRWIEDRLRPIGRAFEDLFRSISRVTPGGTGGTWVLLVLVVAILAALIGRHSIRRRAALTPAPRSAAREVERPRDLERAADAAEQESRWEDAVRLRFRAGLLRLGERRLIEYRPSLTTGEVADTLRSEPFERLGTRFDAIAYGGRDAGADDAGASRADWAEVLSTAAPR